MVRAIQGDGGLDILPRKAELPRKRRSALRVCILLVAGVVFLSILVLVSSAPFQLLSETPPPSQRETGKQEARLFQGVASLRKDDSGSHTFLPAVSGRRLTEWEVTATAVTQAVLHNPAGQRPDPAAKIAFMFLVEGPLPLEGIWARFFKGHEGKFSIYIHHSDASYMYKRENMASEVFVDRNIPSKLLEWGQISTVDAERRLISWALLDPFNHFFVLLSDSCIPIRSFNYVQKYLLESDKSFMDIFVDEGKDGMGRYVDTMMPEVSKDNFVKGSQWVAVNRKHATAMVADTHYYQKFRDNCRQGDENGNCYPMEHYFQTYLHMVNPSGLANYSVTYVDWSEKQWYPKQFRAKDATAETLQRLQQLNTVDHANKDEVTKDPCRRNGQQGPCFLFARCWDREAVPGLMKLPESVLGY